MMLYGGVDVEIYFFLTSALVGGEWSPSHLCHFIPSTHFIGSGMNPTAGLYDMEKLKFLTLGIRTSASQSIIIIWHIVLKLAAESFWQ
jgi:hypothetical protein